MKGKQRGRLQTLNGLFVDSFLLSICPQSECYLATGDFEWPVKVKPIGMLKDARGLACHELNGEKPSSVHFLTSSEPLHIHDIP